MAVGFVSWFSGSSRAPVEHYRVDRDHILGNSVPIGPSVATGIIAVQLLSVSTDNM
jgi:hypothetical protein